MTEGGNRDPKGAEALRAFRKRYAAMKTERSSWDSHWREINENLLPRSGRFNTTDKNDGKRKHNLIIDSTGPRALRVLGAGLMGGATSPARPWFRLSTPDTDMMKSAAVKAWLHQVQRLLLMVFQRSNTYRALHTMYEELGAYGTGASIVLPDFKDGIRHHTMTIGEYVLAQDDRDVVNVMAREFEQTVAQTVRQFGVDKCSRTVKSLFDRGNLEAKVPICHIIEPRADRNPKMRNAANMPFRSAYFEKGGDTDTFLRDGGHKYFRVLAPRWSTVSGDLYGYSPAMEALGDLKQLQHQQMRKAQGIDYMTNPPLQMPMELKGRQIGTLPGGVTYVNMAQSNNRISSMFDVRLDLNHLLMDIQDVRERINSSFYSDLFLMIAQANKNGMTATEVAERHEEKLLMLGPVLERLHNELLDPLIDMAFMELLEADALPPPPEEMQGMELKVEYVSMLAQAQRAVATNSIDRFVGNIGVVAGLKPEVLDKLDADRWADEYADLLGIDPELLVGNEKVAIVRDQRAQQMAQQQEMEAMQQQAMALKNVSAADAADPQLTAAAGF
jgi:hypothetical protein